ncbi:MAG: GntR family transcriptional regulator [Actinomycetia bacterium]|nr:GntR family transcriptional regulator [Actinomycetes bacterium]
MEFRPGVPLRRQLEGALRVAIRSGRLAPGSVLPPSRDLADEIGVSRGVVVDSYAQLATEGYLTAKRGSGTHVALLPASGRPPAPRKVRVPEHFRYDLRPGQADFHAFPRARWKASLVRALRELPDRRLGYANHLGVAELRNAVAGYLARGRGVVVEPEHVVICCATSQALTVLWQALRQQGGRRVAVEDPGWRWQRYTVEHAGLEAVPVRVDADGLVVSELAAADVDAVVMTPAHQYPTGVVMTAERRSALITWARERRALIVEDDYDVEYRFGREPVASLQGLAPDLVAFVGTTSKTLAPALRLAWMVPPSHLIDDVENMLLVTGVTPPTLDQMAMASFIEDAALERHLRSMRRRYRAKREVLVGALGTHLPEVRIGGAAAGLHLLAWLPDGTDEHETAMRARRSGVGVHELHRHCTTHASSSPALILGFALPSESELRTATALLAEAVA